MPCWELVADIFGTGVCTVSDGCVILLFLSGSRAPVLVITAALIVLTSTLHVCCDIVYACHVGVPKQNNRLLV